MMAMKEGHGPKRKEESGMMNHNAFTVRYELGFLLRSAELELRNALLCPDLTHEPEPKRPMP